MPIQKHPLHSFSDGLWATLRTERTCFFLFKVLGYFCQLRRPVASILGYWTTEEARMKMLSKTSYTALLMKNNTQITLPNNLFITKLRVNMHLPQQMTTATHDSWFSFSLSCPLYSITIQESLLQSIKLLKPWCEYHKSIPMRWWSHKGGQRQIRAL